MLSRNSLRATCQKWEIACAKEERKMNSVKKILWTWKGIGEFIGSL
jgi:hypothetical protein